MVKYGYKRKYTKKSKKVSFASKVKKVIQSETESKFLPNELYQAPTANTTLYVYSPTQLISQGVSNYERIGDSVKLVNLKLNGYFTAPPTALTNTKWRVAVFYHSKAVAAATVSTSAFTANELFFAPTYTANLIGGIFDPKAVTLLADQTFDMNSLVNTSEDIKSWAMNIPLRNIKQEYLNSQSQYGKKRNLYVAVWGFTPNTGSVANIGVWYYSSTLEYKDL